MIEVSFIYKSKDGKWYQSSKSFNNKQKAFRFIYAIKRKAVNIEWSCDDPWDNDWLWRNVKL